MTFGSNLVLTEEPGSSDRPEKPARKVSFEPSGFSFYVRKDENVLAASHRLGYRCAHACRNGVCHLCQATLLRGELNTSNNPYTAKARNTNSSFAGRQPDQAVLLCRALPLTDCEFEFDRIRGPYDLEIKDYPLQITAVTALTDTIFSIDLLAPAGSIPEYFAGQYLQLLIPGQKAAFFSITNAPGTRAIQLHIEVQQECTSAVEVLRYLQQHPVVTARLPMGRCYLADCPDNDILLIAAGTGLGQVKAIAEYLLKQQFSGSVTIYWGVRSEREIYAKETLNNWCEQNSLWKFVPVNANSPDGDWQGHHSELVNAVLSGNHQWQNLLVFISGSPTMVYTALDALVPAGLDESRCFSDVFEYAPR